MDNTIQKITIFYFSGTGNSKQIATWFCEAALSKKILCRIVDISKTEDITAESIDPNTAIGIISPTHGFNYPKITLDFIRKFPNGNNKVILMNTRGGTKIGKLITPGLTGVAFMVSSFILQKKGYKIIGQIPFDMPSNWISIHPTLRKSAINFIFEKNRQRVKKHFEKLYSGKHNFASRKDIIQDVLISPVSFAYYIIGKYFLAKSFYASSDCINCNLCIKQCPVKAIKEVDSRPYWTLKCESCMQCMNQCPTNAIETTHGLWLLVVYLTSILSTYIVYSLLPNTIQHWTVSFLLFNIVLIGLMCILYRIQQYLLQNRFIAKIIAFTSLTRYRFWGRYKYNK